MPEDNTTTTTVEEVSPETVAPKYKRVVDHLSEGRTLPDGFTRWAFKTVRPDLTTWTNEDGSRVQWPVNGLVQDEQAAPGGACPSPETGGFALALDMEGAKLGRYGSTTVLLIAYNPDDVIGPGTHKVRVSRCYVVGVLDGNEKFLNAPGVDLSGGNLSGLNLDGGNLAGAKLDNAIMSRVRFPNGSLAGASMRSTDFVRANLRGCDLSGVSANGANFHMVDAKNTNMSGADFTRANLRGGIFTKANVTGTDFTSAMLAGADLSKATADSPVKGITTADGRTAAVIDKEGPFQVLVIPRTMGDVGAALARAGVPFEYGTRTN